LNDATSVLGNGFIHDASGHNWSFSAPNTAIISGAGVGLVTPLADFHTNAAGDPTNVRHFQSADAGLQLGANQQFTVQCWVNFSNDPVLATPPLVSAYTGTTGFFLGNFPAGKFSTIVHDNTNTAQTISDVVPVIGAWNMVTGGWDGTNVWVQTNAGTRQKLAVAQTNATTAAFSIGNYATGVATVPLNGYIGGVNYWKRTLSLAEVALLFNAGRGTFYPFTTF